MEERMTIFTEEPYLTTLKAHPISVLLVDDQPIVAEAIREMLQSEQDISFHYCQDPTKALKEASTIKPTVILQDLLMPQMDGLLLLRYFRANPRTSEIPMIVLSGKEDPEIKAAAFALGANDYLVKIPNKIELIARIRYHSMAYISLLQRNEAYEKLVESQRILFSELAEAAQYVKSQLPLPLEGEIQADWRFIPSKQLGGDAFGYHWLNDDNFVIYLLDVCGHGIGAALLSISILNVIKTSDLILANLYDPPAVLAALNNMFLMERHNNMFFTMWYGVYNKKKREIIYSSGGHPPCILIKKDLPIGSALVELTTLGLVIGGMENTQYNSKRCDIPPGSHLYVFSDGVFEITRQDNTIMSFEDIVPLFVEASKESDDIGTILRYSQEINNHQPFNDDYSIIRFVFH